MLRRPRHLDDYLDALGPELVATSGRLDVAVSGVCVDSRIVQPGMIFCAIPGARDDGGRYAAAAVAAGAVAVVSETALELPPSVAQVRVRHAYHAAGRLAEADAGYPARRLRLIGVTGTNGKTTCAFLLQRIFERAGRRTGMIGTVVYAWGSTVLDADRTTPTPFEYQYLLRRMADDGIDTVVVEVSSHALVQRRTGTVPFAGAIFTNLTRDHLDYHRTFSQYFRAKKILFAECLAAGAPAVINGADPYGRRLLRELRHEAPGLATVAVGTNRRAAARIVSQRFALSGCDLALQCGGTLMNLYSPLIGHYNVVNVAQCATLALKLGVSPDCVAAAIADFGGAPGRLEAVPGDGFATFVDYAHTDDALTNVLAALRQLAPARLTVVFGCGGDRDRSKRPRMGRAAATGADRVIITNDNPRSEAPDAIIAEIRAGMPDGTDCRCIPDRRRAIQTAIAEAVPGEAVLVAGKGHEKYQIVGAQQVAFDDVAEVRAALAARRQ